MRFSTMGLVISLASASALASPPFGAARPPLARPRILGAAPPAIPPSRATRPLSATPRIPGAAALATPPSTPTRPLSATPGTPGAAAPASPLSRQTHAPSATPAIPGASALSPAPAPVKPGDLGAALLRDTAGNFVNKQIFSTVTVQGARVSVETGAIRLNGSAALHGGKPEQVLIEIPESHRGLRLAHIALMHSQNTAEKSVPGSGRNGDRDAAGAYSLVEVFVKGRGWTDLGQSKKFAEARQEVERLHDLPDAQGEIVAVRIKNVGVDPVHLHQLTLHFLPEKPRRFEEQIFTARTSFGDPWASMTPSVSRLREPVVQGTRYPGGVTLNNTGDWKATPPETVALIQAKGWSLDPTSISIPLQAGKRFRTVEVAIGDTHPDAASNQDQSYGYKGYAKLTLEVVRADGTRLTLSSQENVPPQGVLVGTSDYVAQAGDRVRLSVSGDTAAVMGVRLGYAD